MKKLLIILTSLLLLSSYGNTTNKQSASLETDFVKPKGVSFNVNNVEIAHSLLKIDTAKCVFETKIGKEILFFPDEQTHFGLVHCPNNGLIQTLQECYDNHRPLVLNPDVIWLAICQGVSIHINEKYDSLKNVIFSKDKPDKIEIRNDSLEFSAKHWNSLIASFANETKKYTNDDFYSFFVSEFTTTTAIEKTAYQITLLESYKKAFEYVGETGCGIPSILIAGNKKDWQTILKKLDMLHQIGLGNWAKNLKPIIHEFINASDGKQNKEFWQSIYKNANEYNAFYISGWVIKFFPYVKYLDPNGVYDEKRGETRVGEIITPNKFIEDDTYLLSTLSTDNFPSGIAKVPVTWENHFKNSTVKMEVYAGLFAIRQYPDKSLEPFISWAICEENARSSNHKLAENKSLDLIHQPDYWSPHFAKNITDSAIYDSKTYHSQSKSLNQVRTLILNSLQIKSAFNSTDYLNDTLQIEILTNGRPSNVTMTKSKNEPLLNYITELINKLPKQWFPALAHPTDVLNLTDFPEKDNLIKVRTNSRVKIVL